MYQNSRKYMILNAIIRDYIETAEAIGSRALEKKHNFGISPATIRNEMSDLEDMGYLIQPHTSSGRIPSQKAYRLYVDEFMEINKVDKKIQKEVRGVYQDYILELNKAIEHTLSVLTKMTNYTSLIVSPRLDTLSLKDIKLVYIDYGRILLIMVTNEGIIKNKEIRLSEDITYDSLGKVNNALLVAIKDIKVDNLSDVLNTAIEGLSLEENSILLEIIPHIKDVLISEENTRVYSKGVSNILNYPEFNSVEKAKNLIDLVNKEDTIKSMLNQNFYNDITITIGDENIREELKDCSIITANYKLNGKPIGTIGVIGPTRMNYDYAVSTLDLLSGELTKHITKLFEK